jgi:hypothetical protein
MVEGFYYDGHPRAACTAVGSWLGFVFRIIISTKSVCVVLSRSSLLSWVSPKVKTQLIDTCHSQHVARLALGRLTAMADDSYWSCIVKLLLKLNLAIDVKKKVPRAVHSVVKTIMVTFCWSVWRHEFHVVVRSFIKWSTNIWNHSSSTLARVSQIAVKKKSDHLSTN